MGLNIGKEVLDVAMVVKVVVDPTKLGKRQLTALNRCYTTGIIKGDGVPARIALQQRKQMGLPYIHFGRYNRVRWERVHSDHKFFEVGLGAMTASMLASDDHQSSYRLRYIRESVEAFRDKPTCSAQSSYYYTGDFPIDAVPSLTAPHVPFDPKEPIEIELDIDKTWSSF